MEDKAMAFQMKREHAGRARVARMRARVESAEWIEERDEALSLGPVNVKSLADGARQGEGA